MKDRKVIQTRDGSCTIWSEQYGVCYHSRYGAVTESRHVFIEAGLLPLADRQTEIRILETGFGTGLNAFLSYLEALRRPSLQLRYTALEIHPLAPEEYRILQYPEVLDAREETEAFYRMHEAPWDQPVRMSTNFVFEKIQTDIASYLQPDAYDLVYFDAFAPQAQPELWAEEVFARLRQSMRPGAVLVTYCAQGAFRRTLKSLGFEVEKLPGPPGKREMTRALLP